MVEAQSQDPPKRRARRVWLVVAVLSAAALLLASTAASLGRRGPAGPPVRAEGAGPASRSEKPQPVRVAPVRRDSVPLEAEYRGELVAHVAELAAQGSGRLLEVKKNLGDRFTKGEVLAVVDARETRRLLGEAKAQVGSAEAQMERGRAELEAARVEAKRARGLLSEQLLSEQQTLALEARLPVLEAEIKAADAQRAASASRVLLYQEQLAQARLSAPFDGAVAERHLDPGATVQPGTSVLRLVQGGPLRVRFRASEQHLARLEPGKVLSVTTLGTGAKKYAGVVERISAEVTRADRTALAEGVLDAETADLRPGMYATVRVELGTLEHATLVPSTALMTRVEGGETRQGVFVVKDGRAEYRRVEVLGFHDDDAALGGLDAAETVVVFGQGSLKSGDAVAVAAPANAP